LLTRERLCVCHFQDILEIPQTKVSQHLAYLRKRGMVETERRGTWIIYSLPAEPSSELTANLKCLQDCVASERLFREDLERLAFLKSCDGASAGRTGRVVS
jgi:ArsR family transcriptional regulator